MKYYFSHPRAGDIEKNLKEADRRARDFKKLFKNGLKKDNGILIEPFKLIPQDGSVDEHEAMKWCIELLLDCNTIVLAGDWQQSEGCRLEKAIAEAIGLDTYVFRENYQ